MKTLRLLNIAAFFLLFTPFFQMCSDEKPETIDAAAPLATTTDSVSAVIDSAALALEADTTLVGAGQTPPPAVLEEKPSALERFWELITVPGDHFTATAFGLFVITTFDVFGGNFTDIWIGSVLIIISLWITVSTLILLFKRKTNRLVVLLAINLVFILGAFVAALITFDSITQVKWGYYLYLVATSVELIHARATIPKLNLSY